jgi:hypothetical protein
MDHEGVESFNRIGGSTMDRHDDNQLKAVTNGKIVERASGPVRGIFFLSISLFTQEKISYGMGRRAR